MKTIRRREILKYAAAFAAIPFLPACGGGGSADGSTNGDSANTPATVNEQTSASAFDTVQVTVPPIQPGDTYQASWSTLKKPISPLVIDGSTLSVPVPPPASVITAWGTGSATVTIVRSRGGVATSVATRTVDISPLQRSPYIAGTMIRETAALQMRLIQASATKVLPRSGTGYLNSRSFLLGPLGLGTIRLTADQLEFVEGLLYSMFRAMGYSLPTAKAKKATTIGAVAHASLASDFLAGDIDLKGITENLAAKARDSADTLIKVGGAAMLVGGIIAAEPIIVAGAVAVATGLMFGTAESMILQNASVFGGLDGSAQLQWKESVSFFVSNAGGNAFDALLNEYTTVLSSNDVSNHIQAFIQDFNRGNIAEQLGTAFSNAATGAISVADTFSPAAPSDAWLQPDATAANGMVINNTSSMTSGDVWGIQAADAATNSSNDCPEHPNDGGTHGCH